MRLHRIYNEGLELNLALVKKIDTAFSKMIRARDNQGGYFRCCSCSQFKPIEQADAGHFINRRWMTTRWREDNVHAQCRSCNRFDEGNAAGYANFMITKYGQDHVDYLFALSRERAGFSDSDGTLMLQDFKNKLKVY